MMGSKMDLYRTSIVRSKCVTILRVKMVIANALVVKFYIALINVLHAF